MRTRRSLLVIVLVVAVFAALAPAISAPAYDAILVTVGLVVPTIQVTFIAYVATRSDERPAALLSLDFFRAPPTALSVA